MSEIETQITENSIHIRDIFHGLRLSLRYISLDYPHGVKLKDYPSDFNEQFTVLLAFRYGDALKQWMSRLGEDGKREYKHQGIRQLHWDIAHFELDGKTYPIGDLERGLYGYDSLYEDMQFDVLFEKDKSGYPTNPCTSFLFEADFEHCCKYHDDIVVKSMKITSLKPIVRKIEDWYMNLYYRPPFGKGYLKAYSDYQTLDKERNKSLPL